ncbi:MAG: hypothetical protein IJT34_00705 [Butyrivibrio sp.]|nr:hypothetical protein [Butyrivibrio sp.]
MSPIFQQIYNLADSIIVGRYLGSNAFAAVGATGSITFLFFALCNGIGSGGVIGRFTIPVLLTAYLGYGEAGIWLSSGIVWILSGGTAWIRYMTYFRNKVQVVSPDHHPLRLRMLRQTAK